MAQDAPGPAARGARRLDERFLADGQCRAPPLGKQHRHALIFTQPRRVAGTGVDQMRREERIHSIALVGLSQRLEGETLQHDVTIGVADDALGLVLLALFYPSGPISLLSFAAFLTPAIGIALWLRSRRVRNFWPYTLAAGGFSWAAFFYGGFHPALALVPILPFMPHAPRDLGLFNPAEHGLPDTMNLFEHWWHVPVQVILFFFGLTNAGVAFSSVGDGTWIVLSSLLIGKPVGIALTTFVVVSLGLRAPGGLSYRHTAVVGVLAGVGFTVSLFFSTAAFSPGELLNQVKIGALLSLAAVPLAFAVAWAIRLYPHRPDARVGL